MHNPHDSTNARAAEVTARSPEPPVAWLKTASKARRKSVRPDALSRLTACRAHRFERSGRVRTHRGSALAGGSSGWEGHSTVLRTGDSCLCESGSKKVKAISGVGAGRGRVVPAESTNLPGSQRSRQAADDQHLPDHSTCLRREAPRAGGQANV